MHYSYLMNSARDAGHKKKKGKNVGRQAPAVQTEL